MRRLLHRLAVFARDAPGAWDPIQLVGDDVLGGKDRRDAGLGHRLGLVNRHDRRVGMGRAQEDGIKLPRAHDVMHVASAPSQKAPILPPAKGYPNSVFAHPDLPLSLALPRSPAADLTIFSEPAQREIALQPWPGLARRLRQRHQGQVSF